MFKIIESVYEDGLTFKLLYIDLLVQVDDWLDGSADMRPRRRPTAGTGSWILQLHQNAAPEQIESHYKYTPAPVPMHVRREDSEWHTDFSKSAGALMIWGLQMCPQFIRIFNTLGPIYGHHKQIQNLPHKPESKI